MNDDERASTERQCLVLVHDAQSPVRNLAAEAQQPSRPESEDAPIDLTALEAARVPAQTPVTASTDGHRTAAYATGAIVPPPVAAPAPPPDSSIVVEPAVLDEPAIPRTDSSRLAPTIRKLRPPKRDADPGREVDTTPDGHTFEFEGRRTRGLAILIGVAALLVLALVIGASKRSDVRPNVPASAVQVVAARPTIDIPPPPSAEPGTEEPSTNTPPATAVPAETAPRCVDSARASDGPKRRAARSAVDDAPPSHDAKRNFSE